MLRGKVCLSKYKASFVGTKIEQTGKYYTWGLSEYSECQIPVSLHYTSVETARLKTDENILMYLQPFHQQ